MCSRGLLCFKLTSYSLKGTRITRAQVIQKGLYKRSSSSVQRLRGLCEAPEGLPPCQARAGKLHISFWPCIELRSGLWCVPFEAITI